MNKQMGRHTKEVRYQEGVKKVSRRCQEGSMMSRSLTVRVSLDETGLWSETSRLALE